MLGEVIWAVKMFCLFAVIFPFISTPPLVAETWAEKLRTIGDGEFEQEVKNIKINKNSRDNFFTKSPLLKYMLFIRRIITKKS